MPARIRSAAANAAKTAQLSSDKNRLFFVSCDCSCVLMRLLLGLANFPILNAGSPTFPLRQLGPMCDGKLINLLRGDIANDQQRRRRQSIKFRKPADIGIAQLLLGSGRV
jgi:hypothetical protein